jgi:hypothetical protein
MGEDARIGKSTGGGEMEGEEEGAEKRGGAGCGRRGERHCAGHGKEKKMREESEKDGR